ncbi:MAG TPA: trypsin-like peptidase domain-containing protein [Acidimicrobiales bacterium]|nr:trypsin-like peptidase domain-containing protein [Acidimicrobiales bacterium]
MDPEDSPEEESPLLRWLPPDDRLWRHPSELASSATPGGPFGAGEGEDAQHRQGSGAGDLVGVPAGESDSEAGTTGADPGGQGASGAQVGGGKDPNQALQRRPRRALMAITAARPAERGDAASREMDRRLWTVAVLAGVVGALVATSAVVVVGQLQRSTTVVRPIEQIAGPSNSAVTLSTDPSSIGVIADQLRPSIVELLVENDGANVTGSGVVFRSDGYVLTDEHLVQGAQSVIAVMSNGKRITCRIVGGDQVTDVAVVKLQNVKPEAVATLGSSSELHVGQLAIALGSPAGSSGGLSASTGFVSALNSLVYPAEGPPLTDMIQTNATLVAASSGGALVDANGMVVGITTTATIGDQGMQTLTLATPIEAAKDVADQLLSTGRVVHAWLGVEGSDVDSVTARNLGINGGAVVDSVDTGSPAAQAGLVASDVVTGFDGLPVNSMNDLDANIRRGHPGDHVTLTYLHSGATRALDVVLAQVHTDDYP